MKCCVWMMGWSMQWPGHVEGMGEICKGYQILETDRKTPVNRHRYRWNENNVDHEGKKYDSADWM